MAHVADYKKKIVDNIVKLVKEYPIIGAVNMENLPAPQLQGMRAQLRGKVDLAMTKRRIIKIALEKAKDEKKGIEKLQEHLVGMPALIFTKDSPFKLSRILRKNKSKAPAKAGQTAPNDISVNQGPTGFAPGPIIGELGMAGIKAGVENGKVSIKEDTVVVKQGEQIQPKVAEILTRLGIEPMEVGLDLTAAYEDGLIYTKDILTIDDQEYLDRLNNAARNSFNLAFEITYTTKDNLPLLIGKAFNDAKALGLSQEILDEGIVQELLAKAERSMLGLKDSVNLEVPEKAEVKAEEKPKEEAKAEVKEVEQSKPEVKEEKAKVDEKPKVKEEKKVEEPKKEIPKVEGPKTPEPQKEVAPKEEPKKEEPAPKEVPKQEPEVKKPEVKEPIKKEPEKQEKPDTDKKVEDMVRKTKDFAEGKKVTADQIIDEIEKGGEEKEEVPTAEELQKKNEEVETPSAHDLKKKDTEQEEVENLTKELMKKGTLRKK